MTDTVEVLILGGGPGGYTAALHCAELGLSTAVVESQAVGGTCLNIGCIPSKAIIHAADLHHRVADTASMATLGIDVAAPQIDLARTIEWKDGVVARLRRGVEQLLKAGRIEVVAGHATVVDGKSVDVALAGGGTRHIRTEHLVIATGSRPIELPALPFGGPILSSTELLALDRRPDRLAVIGGGYIGLELGTAFAKLGTQVSVVEAMPHVLPGFERDLVRPVERRLAELGISVHVGALAVGFDVGTGVAIESDGERSHVAADVVLVAVGRVPAVDGFGLESLHLDMNGRAIAIDDRCRTSMRGVYAIGDVTGEPMLAHRATAQAMLVAEVIAGRRARWTAIAVPAVCFTDPEIAVAGQSASAANNDGIATVVGRAQFGANGRALTLDQATGFLRLIAREDDGVVIGAEAVGPEASELIAACTSSIEMGATLDDIALTVHSHPTLAEVIHEAALAARRTLTQRSTDQDATDSDLQ